MITMVLGGARSGKSSFAEKIAYKRGANDVVYLATAEIRDRKMAERIKKHQDSRPRGWKTVEEPYDLKNVFKSIATGQLVLLDCLTLYISNILIKNENKELNLIEDILQKELLVVIDIVSEKNIDLVVVSNLVGSGVVPASKLGREFRDIAGRINQLIAEKADEVYLSIAGLPIEIKALGLENLNKYSAKGGEF